jgi:hypothetical protein
VQDLVDHDRLLVAAAATRRERRQRQCERRKADRDEHQPAEGFWRERHRREPPKEATDLRLSASAAVYNQRLRERTLIARRKPT